MELEQIQEAFMKRTMGSVFGFVKLRPGVKRTPLKEFVLNQPEAYEIKIGFESRFTAPIGFEEKYNINTGNRAVHVQDRVLQGSLFAGDL
ncbi:unnamed protein product [Linum trigynum]|uniref:Uncharacterized protein n=1 Tax=Linum trigynum TaxID=586398 RepID=A0AAV2DV98_9ROSI